MTHDDRKWMHHAIQLAEEAGRKGEVPVGAVLVRDNTLIAEGHNCPISTQDPSAHAEIIAMRNAAAVIGNYRLIDTTLYVTLEPCLMCAGAMVHARIKRLVFGAHDTRTGVVVSTLPALDFPFLNHRIDYTGGIAASTCRMMLTDFFKTRRE